MPRQTVMGTELMRALRDLKYGQETNEIQHGKMYSIAPVA